MTILFVDDQEIITDSNILLKKAVHVLYKLSNDQVTNTIPKTKIIAFKSNQLVPK